MKPRIRTIKPEALTDEDLWDAEQETGLPLFRAYAGLWCVADREGRFEWRPRPLKAAILPYWDGDFSRVLDACVTRGFVRKYACNGREYGWIPTFKRHQLVNNREAESDLPAPPEEPCDSDSLTRDARVEHASSTRHDPARGEGKGTEGKGEGTRVDDASRSHKVASRAAGLSTVRGAAVDGKQFHDWLRAGVIKGYESLGKPAPRETRDLLWVGWRELEAWVLDKARLTGRDPQDVGRHHIRCFLRSQAAARKGYPIAFLVANGNEFWTDTLPPEVAA